MALILSGQTELWDKLMLQSYAAIRQRIDIKCVVGRLDRFKTAEYICIPRLINRACTESLMFGAQNRKTILDDRMVKMVVEQELIEGHS